MSMGHSWTGDGKPIDAAEECSVWRTWKLWKVRLVPGVAEKQVPCYLWKTHMHQLKFMISISVACFINQEIKKMVCQSFQIYPRELSTSNSLMFEFGLHWKSRATPHWKPTYITQDKTQLGAQLTEESRVDFYFLANECFCRGNAGVDSISARPSAPCSSIASPTSCEDEQICSQHCKLREK